MALSEFALIKRFFIQKKNFNASTLLGVGDDCALISMPSGFEMAVTTDTMVEQVHFFQDVDPVLLGRKLLAVNLSDLASMGAKPVAVTLALTLPKVKEHWLQAFADGFLGLAEQYGVDLIGGDTTSGALTLTAQAMGLLPCGMALTRSGAKPGDLICLSGNIGDAGLGLKIKQGYVCSSPESPLRHFNCPDPKVEFGLQILSYANACIDISDGLLADLSHILESSGVGGRVVFEKVPLSRQLQEYIMHTGDWRMPLIAGDDYELCFTVAPQQAAKLNIDFWQIGVIEMEPGLRLIKSGAITEQTVQGYAHFC